MLRCSCSLILGSCVWKPGEIHARPTSCITRPLLPVRGVIDGRGVMAGGPAVVLVCRSSFRGRCFAVLPTVGEDGGSFLTIGFTRVLWKCQSRALAGPLKIILALAAISSHLVVFSHWGYFPLDLRSMPLRRSFPRKVLGSPAVGLNSFED